jgi:hypothetical protein
MIIQMTVQMSGGRYDDRQWPAPWHNFEVPDEEGRGLIRCGAAMEVVKQDPEPDAPEPAAAEPAWEPLPSSSAAPAPVPDPEPEPAAPAEEIPLPLPRDPKPAWVEYAVSRGASQAEAEAMTKDQLQAAYGGRL